MGVSDGKGGFWGSRRMGIMLMVTFVNMCAYLTRSTPGLVVLVMARDLNWDLRVQGDVLSAFFFG